MGNNLPNEITVNGDVFELYLSAQDIQLRIAELGRQISGDYRGKIPVFIGVLNGSFVFFADLVRSLDIECEVDFLKLSSYGDAKISSGNVRLLKDLNCQVEGRHIVIVEDIVDTGLSIDYIKHLVLKENPASFAVVTLLHKGTVSKITWKLDYVGFEIPPEFVIGYGLDYAQKFRNVPAIYRMKNGERI